MSFAVAAVLAALVASTGAACVTLRTPFVTNRAESWTGATIKTIAYSGLNVPAGNDRVVRFCKLKRKKKKKKRKKKKKKKKKEKFFLCLTLSKKKKLSLCTRQWVEHVRMRRSST
jgi:hypothetical protein